MGKFCVKCGTPLQEGVIFCHKCGATIDGAAAQQPPMQQQPMAPQQPHYNQTQPYAPIPAKSNKKLIIAVIAIVAVIVIIGLLVFFFVLGGEEGKFVGTWEIESITEESDLYGAENKPTYGTKMTFKSDGKMEISAMGQTLSGDWELKNGKICMRSGDSSDENCADYKFSDGGKTLTITSHDTGEEWDGTEYPVKNTMVLKKV